MTDNTLTATGTRKTAVAKVWLVPGTTESTVNGRPLHEYFGRADLVGTAIAPLKTTSTEGQFGLRCRVAGGGLAAQAAAVALGAARALCRHDSELRPPLKSSGLLKRDPREKERMKYGLAKRRKRFQWTKR
uniref:30S ribosomal protein S9 n=1 Tax=candidate division WOR-3 bacterium TaxID=2052148 RepID=A0A7C4CA99_UNCW3